MYLHTKKNEISGQASVTKRFVYLNFGTGPMPNQGTLEVLSQVWGEELDLINRFNCLIIGRGETRPMIFRIVK